jgi:hypothetical protein
MAYYTPSETLFTSNRTTIATLSLEVTSEANAYAYFEKLRWADGATPSGSSP